jgi:hypothetical protein
VDPAGKWHPFAVDTMPPVGPINVPPEMPRDEKERVSEMFALNERERESILRISFMCVRGYNN